MFQENSIETCILSRVKLIISPGWMHETSARAWCTGKTQKDVVGREEGGGIRRGNTSKSIDGSPPGSPVPGILQARTLEWAAIAFSE